MSGFGRHERDQALFEAFEKHNRPQVCQACRQGRHDLCAGVGRWLVSVDGTGLPDRCACDVEGHVRSS